MKQKLASLLELQKVELEINRLNTVLESVSGRLEALDTKQASLQNVYEAEAAAMDVVKKRYREMESDVQTNATRISKSQEKLGAVKTNKEYQALLKEIDDMREKNSSTEDEMMESIELMEASEKELADKKSILKQLECRIKVEKEDIRRDADADAIRLEEAKKLLKALSEDVDTALMADYTRVNKLVKDRAVVPVLKATCQGCHLNIPPQMFIELQRGDKLKFCPHCSRIIFWNDILEQ